MMCAKSITRAFIILTFVAQMFSMNTNAEDLELQLYVIDKSQRDASYLHYVRSGNVISFRNSFKGKVEVHVSPNDAPKLLAQKIKNAKERVGGFEPGEAVFFVMSSTVDEVRFYSLDDFPDLSKWTNEVRNSSSWDAINDSQRTTLNAFPEKMRQSFLAPPHP